MKLRKGRTAIIAGVMLIAALAGVYWWRPDTPAGKVHRIMWEYENHLPPPNLSATLERFYCHICGGVRSRNQLQHDLDNLGQAAVPALIDELCDKRRNGLVCQWAATQLGRLHDPRAIKPLVECHMLEALYAIGPSAVVPACIEMLREGRDERSALVALESFAPDAQAAVPSLVQIMVREGKYADFAALILGEMGPAARSAIPELTKLLGDERVAQDLKKPADTPRVKAALRAAITLVRIDPSNELAVRTLGRAVKCNHTNIYEPVIRALADIGPDAKRLVPALVERVQWEMDNGRLIREETALALAKIDPDRAAAELKRLGFKNVLGNSEVVKALAKRKAQASKGP
jgi:HEAT repeat protein